MALLLGCLFITSLYAQSAVGIAVLSAAPGSPGGAITGRVTFTSNGTDTTVLVNISGITLPDGQIGIHVHQYGDLRGFLPGAASTLVGGLAAGAHYDPLGTGVHSCPGDATPHHMGDLGNWNVSGGVILMSKTLSTLSLTGANSIIGRMVIVHNMTDDCTTQPTGNAGSRVAAGVIGIANVAGNTASTASTATRAVCVLKGTSNKPASALGTAGLVYFEATAGPAIAITARVVTGDTLEHGFHVHQYGDLSGADGGSAGGHWNLDGALHGLPVLNPTRHLGDLGSLRTYSGTDAWYNNTPSYTPAASLVLTNFLGRAIVVHETLDHGNDPSCPGANATGAAGLRYFTCVIGEINPANSSQLEQPVPPAGLTFNNVWANVPCTPAAPTVPPSAAPTSNSNKVFPFTSANLYPESIAWNPYTKRWILGSAGQGGVYEVDATGAIAATATPNASGFANFGVLVDNVYLYACSSRYVVSPAAQPTPQAYIYKYRIDGGTGVPYQLVASYDLSSVGSSPYRLCNDLAKDYQGNIYATDSFYGVIYRLDTNGNVTVWSDNALYKAASGIGLNGIMFYSNYLVVGRQDTSDLFKIVINGDGSAQPPVYVSYNNPSYKVLQPNAIRFLSKSSIIVMNGTGAVILTSNDNFATIYEVSPRWNSAVDSPSGIMDGNGLFAVLGSDLAGFFTGANVNSYTITELGNDAIPGLYPAADQGWIAAVVIICILAFLGLLAGVYVLITKRKRPTREYA